MDMNYVYLGAAVLALGAASFTLSGCTTVEPYITTGATVSEQALVLELQAAALSITNGKALSPKAVEVLTKQHDALVAARPLVDATYLGGVPPAGIVAVRIQADDLFHQVIG